MAKRRKVTIKLKNGRVSFLKGEGIIKKRNNDERNIIKEYKKYLITLIKNDIKNSSVIEHNILLTIDLNHLIRAIKKL